MATKKAPSVLTVPAAYLAAIRELNVGKPTTEQTPKVRRHVKALEKASLIVRVTERHGGIGWYRTDFAMNVIAAADETLRKPAPKPEPDCRTAPCDLCKKRDGDPSEKAFIADLSTGSFLCEDCWTPEERESTSDPEVEVWRYYTHGWTDVPVCHRCKLAIPVYVDSEGAPPLVETGKPLTASRLFEAAKAHGEESDPDHEVGDLQGIVFSCWARLTPAQHREVYAEQAELLDNLPKEKKT